MRMRINKFGKKIQIHSQHRKDKINTQIHFSILSSESSFESPISISKLNNYSDFGRKSENYFNVKFFSDSRPKSAQNLILKVFSDSQTQIICRLSEFFKK